MTVYAIAQLRIHDRARYQRYVAAFMPILARYGGRLLAARASAAGVDVTYTSWPRLWHDFVLQPGLVAAADGALAQAAWFLTRVRLAA